ncbi:DUF262 domain-containing protein (plasmid) [Aneurinibacillus sp. Ricciae_BoGa-3]|uniref:DUF262 domain-containing protein n=1 Tax=Aneurinibacillus sp. Ricciae_BoGa-3 TaxID=3022697 RepID=UPI002342745D|nr:DUF262 domain-containing protein [Aneurinibacillus sp. Ricciae_BoGa-3]WCK57254.1 DUF262 domain-containing protein [Aneurinibacillus sp. Ricciae_BoGa-3]
MKTGKVSWKVERLAKMFKGKKVNFDLVIQRKKNIWDLKRQSILIHSILSGYPIPALFASKEDSVYNFLDGKQRLTSVFSYISEKEGYPLHQDTPPVEGVEIAGLRFSELPEDFQNRLLQYEIDAIKIEEATQEEMEELFYRFNNGVPLRPIETTRAILGSKVLKFVEHIASMDFFAEKVNLSKSARQRYVDQELVLQILALLKNGETGFSGKELQAFVQELRNVEIQDELRAQMQNACFYLNEAFTRKEKFLKKLHVPMLFKLVLDIQKKGITITPKDFGDWARGFFDNLPQAYFEASQSGSARKENVQKRLSIMASDFNSYLEKKEENEEGDSDAGRFQKQDEAV